MPLAVGGKIGPDEILAKIGAWAMGEVYRASDTVLTREVAIKVLAETCTTDAAPRRNSNAKPSPGFARLSHIGAIYDLAEWGVTR
jgi:hypothetical protein